MVSDDEELMRDNLADFINMNKTQKQREYELYSVT